MLLYLMFGAFTMFLFAFLYPKMFKSRVGYKETYDSFYMFVSRLGRVCILMLGWPGVLLILIIMLVCGVKDTEEYLF